MILDLAGQQGLVDCSPATNVAGLSHDESRPGFPCRPACLAAIHGLEPRSTAPLPPVTASEGFRPKGGSCPSDRCRQPP
jgi:hypothetical protein